MADAALERARRYADAGGDGLFVPGLIDATLIGRVVEGSPLPVNVMVAPGITAIEQVAGAGSCSSQSRSGALSKDDASADCRRTREFAQQAETARCNESQCRPRSVPQ